MPGSSAGRRRTAEARVWGLGKLGPGKMNEYINKCGGKKILKKKKEKRRGGYADVLFLNNRTIELDNWKCAVERSFQIGLLGNLGLNLVKRLLRRT